MRQVRVVYLLLAIALPLSGGCSRLPAREGEACTTSAECAAGLFCDSTQDPRLCVTPSGPRPDLGTGDLSNLSGDLATQD